MLWPAALRLIRAQRSVVLCYHGVAPRTLASDPDYLRVEPERFRATLRALLDAGFTFVPLTELVARTGPDRPPPGLAALTFDDGWDDNHRVALPILRELGLPATVFVISGWLGKPNPWLPPGEGRMMTRPELSDLVAAGVTLGAHTVDHPDLRTLDEEACLAQMTESRAVLEEIAGGPVDTFAYPYCFYGPPALRAAARAGFTCAVTCQGQGSWSPLELKRALITGKDGPFSITLKLLDLYQPLLRSGPGLAARKLTRGARRRYRRSRGG